MPSHVTVYSPEGKKEVHLRLNAVDLVRHCNYSYKPGAATPLPTESAPYARVAAPEGKSAAQSVLDRYGSGSGTGAMGAEMPRAPVADEAEVFDAGVDAAEEQPFDAGAGEETEEVDAEESPAEPTPRRRRAKAS